MFTAFITLLAQHFTSYGPSLTPMFTLPYTARARACGCSRRVPPDGGDGGGDTRVGPRTVAGVESLVASLPSRLPSFLVYDGRNDVTPPRACRCVCKQSPQAPNSPSTPALMSSECSMGCHFHFALLAADKMYVCRHVRGPAARCRVQPVPRTPTY